MLINNILFRVDSNALLGGGHFSRCLTLAKEINRYKKYKIIFACKYIDNTNLKRINYHKFEHYNIKYQSIKHQYDELEDAKCINEKFKGKNFLAIVDNYFLSEVWEKSVAKSFSKIFVIDDLANRKHFCNYLLDQTFGRNGKEYHKYVNKDCQLFIGSKYALIRNEFLIQRNKTKKNNISYTIDNIFISIGYIDEFNLIPDILNYLDQINWRRIKPILNIAISNSTDNLNLINSAISKISLTTNLYLDNNEISKIMGKCQLAIGSAGVSTWERCCLGLPSIVLVLAENQKLIAKNLKNSEAGITIQRSQLTAKRFKDSIMKLISNKALYKTMIKNCHNICDGYGVKRISKEILNLV